jgi:lipoate-protein ligase A
VNFTFIKNVKTTAEISFKQFTAPVVEALAKLGVTATTSGRNDLLINGLKISGNAEHVYKNRVLHHGTLLFNSDLENLGQAIKVVPGKYESKAVQSNRSPVANISQFLKNPMATEEFMHFLIEVQLGKPENSVYELSETDNQNIETHSSEKFQTWEWNFGYSPKYTFRNEVEFEGKILKIEMFVEKGKIEKCTISGEYFNDETANEISIQIQNKRHSLHDINDYLRDLRVSISENLVYSFF